MVILWGFLCSARGRTSTERDRLSFCLTSRRIFALMGIESKGA